MAVEKQVPHLLTILLLPLCLPWITLSGASSSDEEFYLAFLRPHAHFCLNSDKMNLKVALVNPTAGTAKVKIHIRSQITGFYLQLRKEFEIQTHQTDSFFLPDDLVLSSGSVKHSQYAYVTSNTSIIVEADMSCIDVSSYAFMVSAKSSLKSDYLVATHCDINSTCVFVVTSTEDGNDVRVYLRITSEGGAFVASYDGVTYADDDNITETLDKGQSMQVSCHGCDLTGTRVVSAEPVAVFGGGSLQYDSRYKTVAEQMVPSVQGRSYVLPHNYTGSPADFESNVITIKVVLPRLGDSFTYSRGLREEVKQATVDRQVFVFSRTAADDVHGGEDVVKIDSPVSLLVVEVLVCGLKPGYQGVTMTLPLPVQRWATSFMTYIPDLTPSRLRHVAYISLLLPSQVKPEWLTILNNDYKRNWTITYESYKILWVEYKTTGMRQIICDYPGCVPFVGFVMYHRPKQTSAYSLIPAIYQRLDQSTAANSPDVGNATTAASPTTPELCLPVDANSCPCDAYDEDVTEEEKKAAQEKAAAEIKKELLIDRKKLSSYIRAKTSAPDPRTTPKVVGGTLGVFTCILIFAFFVASDAVNVMRALSWRIKGGGTTLPLRNECATTAADGGMEKLTGEEKTV